MSKPLACPFVPRYTVSWSVERLVAKREEDATAREDLRAGLEAKARRLLVAKREEDATARFSLRLPEDLRAKLEDKARRHGISLNAEMVLLLNDALHQEQIERIVFGRHCQTLTIMAQVINGLEKVDGKRLEEDFRNIMQTAAEVVIRFMENAPAAFASGEYPGGLRDRIDATIVQMLRPFGELLPPQDVEALRAAADPNPTEEELVSEEHFGDEPSPPPYTEPHEEEPEKEREEEPSEEEYAQAQVAFEAHVASAAPGRLHPWDTLEDADKKTWVNVVRTITKGAPPLDTHIEALRAKLASLEAEPASLDASPQRDQNPPAEQESPANKDADN
jgi:hypothetical protein